MPNGTSWCSAHQVACEYGVQNPSINPSQFALISMTSLALSPSSFGGLQPYLPTTGYALNAN